MKVLRAEILASAAGPAGFPPPTAPEVALLGRSNVGKSSLLNRLVQRRKLARTSSTPGKTRLVHFYRVEGRGREIRLVDLPGYGWARVARSERRLWKALVESYLERGPALRVAVLLQDLRRDLSRDEEDLLDWLGDRNVPALLAVTKCDKEKPMRRAARLRELTAQVPLRRERVVATSASSGLGIDELWKAIDALLGEAPAPPAGATGTGRGRGRAGSP